MTILRDLSVIWSLIHVLILFMFLYESRYSRNKAITLTAIFMIPLMVLNLYIFFKFGPEFMGKVLLLTCTIPSLIFFWFMAKYRDGRFLFTFCVVDTIALEILYISNHFLSPLFIPIQNFLFVCTTEQMKLFKIGSGTYSYYLQKSS